MARTRVRWGRVGALVASAGLAVTLAAGVAQAGGPGSVASSRDQVVAPRTYVVRGGDTLWRIASHLAGPDGDPRPVVDALVRANHVAGVLVPGERLVLPG
jgi:Tfp pilus assembly protein FimV